MSGALRVGIVGCGLIGQKRLKALPGARVTRCADLSLERATVLARMAGDTIPSERWQDVVESTDVDIVIVATPNNVLAEIAAASAKAGKHVLIEKPAGRSVDEVKVAIKAAESSGSLVRVGFNHRYHPAFVKAVELFRRGEVGDLLFIRGRYGHGGRVGYDKEWRANPELSGGGELIDQGVHLIDLARMFLGDFTEINGHAQTYFWDMPVDDKAFMTLRTERKQTAFLQVSCTEWKNLFSFEIYGRTGKLHIEGLGGSYGVERLSWYKMLPEMGPPETTIWEYPRGDQSWYLEFSEFVEDIRLRRQPTPGLKDALAALEVVQSIYSRSGYDYYS